MFKKILVALDRSEMGRRVFGYALALAKSFEAELTFLHVVSDVEMSVLPQPTRPAPHSFDLLGQNDFELYFQQWDHSLQEGRHWLQALAAEATLAGVTSHIVQSHGSIGQVICEEAKQVDLVILGRRGYSGLGEFFLGSISNYVVHHCPCATWVVQTGQVDLALPDRLLVAVEHKMGQQIVAQSLSLAKALKAQLNLVHILSGEEEDSPSMALAPIAEDYGILKSDLKAYQAEWQTYEQSGLNLLKAYQAAALEQGIAAEVTQSLATPGPGLCSQAQNWGADVIVMGRRRLSGLEQFWLGSVSNYVLHHSPVSVLMMAMKPLS